MLDERPPDKVADSALLASKKIGRMLKVGMLKSDTGAVGTSDRLRAWGAQFSDLSCEQRGAGVVDNLEHRMWPRS